MNFNVRKDVEFALESKVVDVDAFAKACRLSKAALSEAMDGKYSDDTIDKIYSHIYSLGIRLTAAKSEVFQKHPASLTLYHGSVRGVEKIDCFGSRLTADFSHGFYLSPILSSAVSFVEENKGPSVYAFKADLEGLNIVEFDCSTEWMIAISLFRGRIDQYKNHDVVKKLLSKIEGVDVIIAPIVDNKMFEILNQFADGLITDVEAVHSLSASRLGKQYVFKTQKAVDRLTFLDRMYIVDDERKQSMLSSRDRSKTIQTKLDFAKREFRGQGLYIDEVFK